MDGQTQPLSASLFRKRLSVLRLSMAFGILFGSSDLLSAQHTATLESELLRVKVVDNEALGPVHRRGYNGLAALSLREDSSSLFVPAYAGLNFEHIFSGDVRSFSWNKFEPRQSPMRLSRHAENRVELRQEGTAHWPLSSRIDYALEGNAIDFTFCATPFDDAWTKHGYIGAFFASYIHQPEEMGIHFLGMPRGQAGRIDPAWIYHLPRAHGVAANHRPAGSSWDPPLDQGFNIPLAQYHSRWEYAYPFYYGRSGDNVFIMMFADPPPGGEIRFAQSPSGAGHGNPAWDFILLKRDYTVDQEFCFAGRAVYKRFVSESDVVDTFEQWSGREVRRPPPTGDRVLSVPSTHPSTTRVFETVLAPATTSNPRQSEGDVVVFRDGSLLAGWTDFYGGGRDDAPARILAARSRDGGRTWDAPFTLQENTGDENVMSVSFLRSGTGDLLFFYLEKNSLSDLDVMVRRSSDDGQSWGKPLRVTEDPGYHVMNNARVIQLRSGRILCPIAFTEEVWTENEEFRTTAFYSDDDGRTWRRSRDWLAAPQRGAMEPGLVELVDGRILQIIRTQMGRIWHSVSSDQGATWTEAEPWTVEAPEAPSTLVQIPNSNELLLIYNPDVQMSENHLGPRTPLVATLSSDEGQSWSEPKLIEESPDSTYAYTSVTFHDGRALLTYYVSPRSGAEISLKFKSIPIDWFRE
jgi:hypothetical protein